MKNGGNACVVDVIVGTETTRLQLQWFRSRYLRGALQ